MTLFSFIALALGMVAATADRVPRTGVALIAVARGSRATAQRLEQRTAGRTPTPAARPARIRPDHRPLRPPVSPLRGSVAARAPGM